MKGVDSWDGVSLVIRFGNAPDFDSTLTAVKQLPGRQYLPSRRYWTAPATIFNINRLVHLGFQPSDAVKALLQKLCAPPPPMPEIPCAPVDAARLTGFRPFQVRAVEFLEARDGNGLVGDDMGLGKTVEGLGFLLIHPEARPAVVVCPGGLKLNWAREIEKWLKEDPLVIFGESYGELPDRSVYVINYEILAEDGRSKEAREAHKRRLIQGWYQILIDKKPRALILDESHYIANSQALRTKAVFRLARCESVKHVIPMSGTPIRKSPKDLWTSLHLIAPSAFPVEEEYLNRYCGPTKAYAYWLKKRREIIVYKGASNVEELTRKVAPYMIRRTKAEVLPELPPKVRSIVPMETSEVELRAYHGASAEFLTWIIDHMKAGLEKQSAFARLLQLVYLAKRNAILQWVDAFLRSGEKLIVAAYHIQAVEDIYERFKLSAVKMTGSDSVVQKQAAVDRFQQDADTRLFVGEIRAANVGHTLTASHSVAIAELTWIPSDMEQMEDRVLRIGQTADSMNAYYLVAEDTIEIDIMDVLQSRYEIGRRILRDEEKADTYFKLESGAGADSIEDKLIKRLEKRRAKNGLAG